MANHYYKEQTAIRNILAPLTYIEKHFEKEEVEYRCPSCRSEHITKKDISKRTVLDVTDDGPISITYYRQRCRCKDCGLTFTLGKDPYPKKKHITTDFGGYISRKILENPELTLKDVADTYGISSTSVSSAIHDYTGNCSTMVSSYTKCYQLFIYPFVYERQLRSCVCGTDEDNQRVLLTILPEYTESTISDFIKHHYGYQHEIEAAFCRFDSKVVQFLHSYYYESAIGILYQCIMDEIKKYKGDSFDELFSAKIDQLVSLEKVFMKSNSKTLNDNLEKWKQGIPDTLSAPLYPLVDLIGKFQSELTNTMDYSLDEMDFHEIEKLILRFKKNGASFDIMVLRMLYFNSTYRNKIERTEQKIKNITSKIEFTSGNIPLLISGINGYSVKIDDLIKEFDVTV